MKDKNIFGRIKAKTNKLDLETVKSGEDLTCKYIKDFFKFLSYNGKVVCGKSCF